MFLTRLSGDAGSPVTSHWLLYLLLLISVFAGCRQEQSLDLIALAPFAEAIPDTEVLLFATPKMEKVLTSWSEPRQQPGGRFRWSLGDKPSFSWSRPAARDTFLHLRVAAHEPLAMQVRLENIASSLNIMPGWSIQSLPLPYQATRAEFLLPEGMAIGLHSAVISASRHVAEFRKPAPFPSIETITLRGKKRPGLFFETGGVISFYEMISTETALEFGYYFSPAGLNDHAVFSVMLTGPDHHEKLLFQRRAAESVFGMERIPFDSYVSSSAQAPHKISFRISRNTAFGESKTGWIQPQLYQKSKPAATARASRMRGAFAGANVLFIVLDAATVRRFGCYGYDRNTTPEIDRFNRTAMQFDRAYTNAVYTLASTATTFTGLLPFHHGILKHGNRLAGSAITLAETLQLDGYETAGFVANGNASSTFGLTQGFETLREVFRDKRSAGRAEDVTNPFIEWFRSRKKKRFFAYLHFREPHDPYQPPVQWVQRFVNPKYSGPLLKDFKDKKPLEKNSSTLSAEDRNFISDLYDANLAYGDSQVGRILGLLKRANVYDSTMIVLTSDHGEAFWEHGYQGHNIQLFEESVRVPLIIKFPRNNFRGQKFPYPVQHADLYSTILELLGVRNRGTRDGTSFAPWLKEETPHDRPILIQTTKRPTNAILLGNFKYIQDGESEELYNLLEDPLERKNLAQSQPVFTGYLRQLLHRWLQSESPLNLRTEKAVLDEEARENLKALGYLD